MSHILVGVSGSIAAFKACALVSKLVQAGHAVDVVMTRGAGWFVRPLSFSALTHRRVFTDETWGSEGAPADHLIATSEADLMIVAPCTANLIGKFAHGIADEIVTTSYLGCQAPVLIAPAMNWRMWAHPRVQANIEVLRGDGVQIVGPEDGYLAEKEEGPGRMTEPEGIMEAALRILEGQ